jgi:hypothetical protein
MGNTKKDIEAFYCSFKIFNEMLNFYKSFIFVTT